MRTSNLQIPTVENVSGKLSVKFSTKTYPEFLKDNTQTNLRSVDLDNGNYSYTVQRNIVFATPKVEKIEQPKVEKPIDESKPNIDIESKKADIEKRRKEDIASRKLTIRIDKVFNSDGDLVARHHIYSDGSVGWEGVVGDDKTGVQNKFKNQQIALKIEAEMHGVDIDSFNVEKGEEFPIESHPTLIKINAKYDAELAALEQQKPEVKVEKPQQQRRGNGKSIERKKPLSDEDLMPNFNEVAEESTEFKTKPKANTLQMDFITFAKMQEPEIKRSLIAMNRNKEIEVKCK